VRRHEQKHADDFYLAIDWFGPDESTKECMKVRVIVTRKEHRCAFADIDGASHQIPKGTKALKESGKVDGHFGSCYSCLKCLDRWAKKTGLEATR
jgi:hypothetical protein